MHNNNSAEYYIKKAIDFAESNRLDHALTHGIQAYFKNPGLRDLFARIGNVCYKKGESKTALEFYERDRYSNRLSPPYRQILAFLLAHSDRLLEARTEITRAYAEDPSLLYGYALVDPLSGSPLLPADQDPMDEGFDEKAPDPCENPSVFQNGYASLGSIHRAFACYEKALYYYERDRKLEIISPSNRLIYAHLLTYFERINEANEEVSKAYNDDTTLRDGYALIGSVYRNLGFYEKALSYYEYDNFLNRLSPANRHIFADHLARFNRINEAESEVQRGYIENPSLKNGFARIGSIFKAKSDFDTALKYYERDRTEGRLLPFHRVVFAELLARTGNMKDALNEVRMAYEEDLSIRDGYSRCGWLCFWGRSEYDKVVELCERDRKKGRLSKEWTIHLAQAYAASGSIEAALCLVKNVYETDPEGRDGHARCAWSYYWPRKEYHKAIDCIEKDISPAFPLPDDPRQMASPPLGGNLRLSPRWGLNLALVYSALGHLDRATAFVDWAYREDGRLQDGYGRIALKVIGRFPARALELFERDHALKRQSPGFKAIYARQITSIRGALSKKALRLVAEAYKQDAALQDGFSGVARALQEGGDSHVIRRLVRKEIRRHRLSNDAAREHISFLYDVRGVSAAAEFVRLCYDLQPNFTDGYAAIGDKLQALGHMDVAERFYQKDFALGKLHDDSLVSYLLTLISQGKSTQVSSLLQELKASPGLTSLLCRRARVAGLPSPVKLPSMTERPSGSAQDMVNLAAALVSEGRVEEAIHLLQGCGNRLALVEDPYSACARTALAVKDRDAAKRLFRMDVQLGHPSAGSLFQYAQMLEEDGDRQTALSIMNRALSKLGSIPIDPWISENRDSYRNRRCFILGTGPSLNSIDPDLLAGGTVFATNGAFLLPGLKVDFYVTVSNQFWRHHVSDIKQLCCSRMFIPSHLSASIGADDDNVSRLNVFGAQGRDLTGQSCSVPVMFSEDPSRIVFTGGTVIFICLQLAFFLGFNEIVLLGVDHSFHRPLIPKSGTYSVQSVPDLHFSKNYYSKDGVLHINMDSVLRAYELARSAYRSAGRNIVNASAGTMLDVFPKIDFIETYGRAND